MPKKPVLHTGGSKEAPVSVVGRSGLAGYPQREQIFTPDDAEFQRYGGVLRGFFEKLLRWDSLLEDERIRSVHPDFFYVLQTPTGSVISPWRGRENEPDESEKVLAVMRDMNIHPDPDGKAKGIIVQVCAAGKQVLVDPEGIPIHDVNIRVYDIEHIRKSLVVKAEYNDYTRYGWKASYHPPKGVRFNLSTQPIEIENWPLSDRMSVPFAIHLFQTVDSLIPNTTSPTPQNGHVTTHERRIPRLLRLLSAPGRRPVGR